MDEINTNSELNFVEVKKPSHILTRFVLFGGLFLILLGTVMVYGYAFTRDNFFSFQTNQSIQAAGRVYLTLTPLSGQYAGRTDIYFFDIVANKLTRFADPDGSSMTLTPRGAGDRSMVFSILKHAPAEPFDLETLITKYNSDSKELTYFFDVAAAGHDKQLPSWSNEMNGALYMTPLGDSKLPEDATVYFTNAQGSRKVTNGLYPQFLPDGLHFIVLKNDGLYLMKVDSDFSRKILSSFSKVTHPNQTFDIAADGSLLAWTQPEKKKIYIVSLQNLFGGDELKVTSTVKLKCFLPVFSPQGNQLTVVEVSASEPSKQSLVVVDLVSKSKKVILDLKNYDIGRLFVTDWMD
ncbi:MAG: hypothetical protein Q8O53_02405 [Candidatus Moranbacteria bacterium]|nr:hypothetical protein [Candidatus Moranbacteria bacterium]